MLVSAINKYNIKSSYLFNPKVVLFDMDGVLYDSMKYHDKAWQKVMSDIGIKFTSDDSYATEGARGVDTIRLYAKKQLNKNLTIDEAETIYQTKANYYHKLNKTPKIFDGVIELMGKIKKDGLKIGIVTGSGQPVLIERLLQDFKGFITKDQITSAFDVSRGKPNPEPYLVGLKKAGNFAPYEGIVVENAPLGIRSGVGAGCFTIAINSGPLPNSDLLKERPNMIFPSIREFYTHWDEFITCVR